METVNYKQQIYNKLQEKSLIDIWFHFKKFNYSNTKTAQMCIMAQLLYSIQYNDWLFEVKGALCEYDSIMNYIISLCDKYKEINPYNSFIMDPNKLSILIIVNDDFCKMQDKRLEKILRKDLLHIKTLDIVNIKKYYNNYISS